MVDPAARRLVVASAVRLHVATRLGADVPCADPAADAARLAGTAELERRYALTFSPGYPGATAGTETVVGGERLVLAATASHRGEPAALVVTTLVRGRPPQVTAAPPDTPVPPGWVTPRPAP